MGTIRPYTDVQLQSVVHALTSCMIQFLLVYRCVHLLFNLRNWPSSVVHLHCNLTVDVTVNCPTLGPYKGFKYSQYRNSSHTSSKHYGSQLKDSVSRPTHA